MTQETPVHGTAPLAYDSVTGEQWLADSDELPRRPRRRLLTPLPLSLLAVLLVALGFIGGVLVEKGEGSSSSTAAAAAAGGGSALASRQRALAGARGAGGSASSSSTGAIARPTAGTVAYLEGSTLYVTDAEGNTIKVTTSPATAVTKNVKASVPSIHPGETVTIIGASGASGAVSAESITVGGAGGFAGLFGGSRSGSGSGSGGTAGSAGQALFGTEK